MKAAGPLMGDQRHSLFAADADVPEDEERRCSFHHLARPRPPARTTAPTLDHRVFQCARATRRTTPSAVMAVGRQEDHEDAGNHPVRRPHCEKPCARTHPDERAFP